MQNLLDGRLSLFDTHLDLVQRVIYHGFWSLTPEERTIIRGYPDPSAQPLPNREELFDRRFDLNTYVEAIMIQEDLRFLYTVLG